MKLSENALTVLKRRYLKKDKEGKVAETPDGLFRRVARAVAGAEKNYGKTKQVIKEIEQEFYSLLSNREFMPNSPTLMNAGRDLGQLSACFSGDQIIITEAGPRVISEIKEGDMVLTQKNRFRKVTQLFKRPTREIYILDIFKLPSSTLKITQEHPVWTLKKWQQHPSWIQVKDLEEGDYVGLSFISEIKDKETIKVLDFLNGHDLVERDGYLYEKNHDIRIYERKDGSLYLRHRNRSGLFSDQVKPVKNIIKVDSDLLRLFGYYLSEGCISDGVCLRFTFSQEEENYCRDIIKIVEDKFGVSARIEYPGSGRRWLSLRFHSKILAQFFEAIFSTGFATKRIPSWILTLPTSKQKGLLAGLFRGDSTVFQNGNNLSTKLVMCNMNVVYAAWQIFMRLECFTSLAYETMPKRGTVQPYKCQVSGKKGSAVIAELLDRDLGHNGIEWNRHILQDGVFFSPIKKISRQDYNGLVYNIEVEEDHSYVASFVGVHNCFVLPIEDSMRDIFETIKSTAIIHQSGGGTGFSFSRLRPKNSLVKSTGGLASGPVSFMKVFDAATDAVKQGGTRRGANMGILRIDHPDILEFITCKEKDKEVSNFNISVAITDEFMRKLEKDEDYDLVDPHTKKTVRLLNTKKVFDLIVRQAHKNGEPGIIFIDRMNKYNPTPQLGKFESTNPCGEQILLPYESCNLGSINLSVIVKENRGKYEIDWDKLRRTTRLAVRFLDNVIDINKFPLPQIEERTRATRKVGLGVMGWASMLCRLMIPYNSEKALRLAGKIMSFISQEACWESRFLAKEKGIFPAHKQSIYAKKKNGKIRNAALTTIAPTGTISIIAGPCSSGIEPLFALCYYRKVMDNDKLIEVDNIFEEVAKKRGFYSRRLMEKIAEVGSVRDIPEVPEDIKRVFVTAHDISAQWHIKMQAAFQRWTHNAVSKTINCPQDATLEDIRKAYLLAYQTGCKGITIYRDKSREEQVLNIGKKQDKANKGAPVIPVSHSVKIGPRPRPEVTLGTTSKVSTGCGNLYVTINCDEQGRPFEVFTQMGKAGGCAASQLEAVGRLVSLSLRSGVDLKSMIEQLKGIRCPSPSWEKGKRIFSCADAIARVIEKRLVDSSFAAGGIDLGKDTTVVAELPKQQNAVSSANNIIGVCPDCGGALRHEEGCIKCQGCGFSKC